MHGKVKFSVHFDMLQKAFYLRLANFALTFVGFSGIASSLSLGVSGATISFSSRVNTRVL